MSFLKRFIKAKTDKQNSSADSARSTTQLVSSNNNSFFEESFSPSALGTDLDTNLPSYPGKTSANDQHLKASHPVAVQRVPPKAPNLLGVPGTSPRRPTGSPTQTSCRSYRATETSIEVLEDKLRKLSGAVSSATLVSDRGQGTSLALDEKLDLELRKMEAKTRRIVTSELDANKGWQALAAEICHPDRPKENLFTESSIQLLNGINVKSPTDEILKTWSTTGRNRPKLRDLFNVLSLIEQVRVATKLAEELGVRDGVFTEENSCVLGSSTESMVIDAANLEPYLEGMYQICFDSIAQATHQFSIRSTNKIGEGNFGTVYKVIIDGEEMAVKRFKDPAESKLFFNEISTLGKLHHPNLLSLYGVSMDGDERCIITRYMKNGNLERRLREEILPWDQRLHILRDVACALEHMHSLKPAIIHRDVKPANILLDDDMNALLGDFGLSREKQSDCTSFTQTCAGTSHYMPVEVMRGDVTVKSDMYSFGVVLLEIFTGLKVFDSLREDSHLTDHVEGKQAQDLMDRRLPALPTVVREGLFSLGRSCVGGKNSRPEASTTRESLQQFLEHLRSRPQFHHNEGLSKKGCSS